MREVGCSTCHETLDKMTKSDIDEVKLVAGVVRKCNRVLNIRKNSIPLIFKA